MIRSIFVMVVLVHAFIWAEEIDRVAIVVGDQPVLKSEVEEKIPPNLTPQQRELAKDAAIQQLTTEIVLKAECRKLGLTPVQDEIVQAEANVMKQHNLTPANFELALSGQGLTRNQFRKQLEDQLCRMKLVQAKVKSRVQITKADVKQAYEAKYGRGAGKYRVHIHQMLFKGKSAESKKKAVAALNQIQSGSSFFDVAKKTISENSDVEEGDLGVFSLGEMSREFEKIAFSIREKETGGPVETSSGFHLIYLKKRIPVEKIPLEKVEKDLHKQLNEEEMDRAFRQYVDELLSSYYVDVRNKGTKPTEAK